MLLIDTFRNRLHQINAAALSSPFPNMAEEMAQTTESLRSEYGDISKGVEDVKGIEIAVIDYLTDVTQSTLNFDSLRG